MSEHEGEASPSEQLEQAAKRRGGISLAGTETLA